MGFDLLTVTGARHEDEAMYPVTGRHGRAVAMEPGDGRTVSLVATALAVGEVSGPGISEIRRFGPISAEVLVTDARVAVACARFERGAVARRRRALVGHVRYAWLWQVGANPQHGVRGDGQLRLILGHDTGEGERLLALDLTLPRHVDVLRVAQDITQRAARFRLRSTEVADDHVTAFRDLADAPRLVPQAKCFASYTMPGYLSAHLPERPPT